ncbi:winged helix-turn-helix domain-containing protein [Achromobacter insuavis]
MAHVLLTCMPESGDRLQFADLELDLLRCRAYRDGEPLLLTPKEFGLLAMLMGSPGAVFTSWQLAESVWQARAPGLGAGTSSARPSRSPCAACAGRSMAAAGRACCT